MEGGERRDLGRVYTPPGLVEFMVGLASPRRGGRVLEPGCAHAPFLQGVRQAHGSSFRFEGVELDRAEAEKAPGWARIHREDFLLFRPEAPYDLVIGNPPYGIVGDGSKYAISHQGIRERKATYQRHLLTWRGKYNLYGAFIERSAEILAPGGQAVLVVPASWLVLEDFALLRQFLAYQGRTRVFYVGAVFPGRSVYATVLDFRKGERGLELWDAEGLLQGKAPSLALEDPAWRGEEVSFPATPPAKGRPLGERFSIRMAARSPDFRRKGVYPEPRPGTLPVLTGRNLFPGRIDYERNHSGLWVEAGLVSRLHPYYASPHLVVGATKGVRAVAAWDKGGYPWREEYHLRPLDLGGGLEGWEILEYLNSEELNRYLKARYRNFTPHLTQRMLGGIPLP